MAHRRPFALPFTAVLAALVVLACVSPAPAAPEGTMTIGVHVTLVSRWLDPAETEGLITPFMVLSRIGIYAYGVLPELEDLFFRQAKELDRKQREAMLHQMQRSVAEHTLVAPLFQQAFIWGVGKRVAEPGAGLIEGYPYVGPAEDLRLR